MISGYVVIPDVNLLALITCGVWRDASKQFFAQCWAPRGHTGTPGLHIICSVCSNFNIVDVHFK